MVGVLAKNGRLIVAGPAIWELHDYPGDYWRPLPSFYIEFAQRNGLRLDRDHFDWILGEFKHINVDQLRAGNQLHLPSKRHATQVFGRPRAQWSRIIHRLLNTNGRQMFFPYCSLGVVVER
jgi:hypothetical protein